MPSLVEILCCLEEEIGLVCWQLVHDMHATEIFGIQPTCELFLFSFKLVVISVNFIDVKMTYLQNRIISSNVLSSRVANYKNDIQ